MRLEFQTEMFCRNSVLIKLISTCWFYMNFKGHKKIKSGILKNIPTRWYEPIPKDLEEACCFCFVFEPSGKKASSSKAGIIFTAFQDTLSLWYLSGTGLAKSMGRKSSFLVTVISFFSFVPDFFFFNSNTRAAAIMMLIITKAFWSFSEVPTGHQASICIYHL